MNHIPPRPQQSPERDEYHGLRDQTARAQQRAREAELRVAAVLYLHQADGSGRACDGCGQTYPCNTRRLLDGRQT